MTARDIIIAALHAYAEFVFREMTYPISQEEKDAMLANYKYADTLARELKKLNMLLEPIDAPKE